MIQAIGLDLSQRLYEKLVVPIMRQHFPGVAYAAARIGLGSEVLGYDNEMSADHDYGPCIQLFLTEADFPAIAETVMGVFDDVLPSSFEGWPTRYPTHTRPRGAQLPGMLGSDHGVELYTMPAWCDHFLGRQFTTPLTYRDWLSWSEQTFLTVTAGAVFRDEIGELTALRNRLSYFPRDVWLCKLAAQWNRIAEERAYIGRAGSVGDDIGSRIVAARMVGNIMRLAMLVERRYAPYPKWFGTAFSRLPCAGDLSPILTGILSAEIWQDRETGLLQACRFMAELQIERGIPGARPPVEGSLHARPFRFVDSLDIFEGLRAAIEDEALRGLPEFGGADQVLDRNFVLAVPRYAESVMKALHEADATGSEDIWEDRK